MSPHGRSPWILCFAALITPTSMNAQWTVSLTGPKTAITVTPSGVDSSKSQPIARRDTITLTVACSGLDCTKVSAAIEHGTAGVPPSPLTAAPQSKTSATFQIQGNMLVAEAGESAPDVLGLHLEGGRPDPVFSVRLIQPAATSLDEHAGGGQPAEETVTLTKLLATDCSGKFSITGGSGYSPETNQGLALVSPTGNLLSPLPTNFDEDDDLMVIVVGDVRLLPLLSVRRTSAFRQVGNLTIVGQDVNLTEALRSRLQAKRTGCGVDTIHVNNFAPGRGEVAISTATGQTIGSFDLAVNHLYWGAFSMGVIRTPLIDPTFGLFFNGTDSVITVTTDGLRGVDKNTHRILYTVLLTPFVWGHRDIEKPVPLIQHLNPTIGLVLNDVPNNFVAGVTADVLNSVFVTAGAHAGKVHELDPRSGLSVGDAFSGPSSDIPTLKRWHTKFFVGVSVDLRAAAQLLRAVLGSAAGQ
jgi:hypothetical protein